jgi:hypothetical protein
MLWHFVEMSMILSVPSIRSLQDNHTPRDGSVEEPRYCLRACCKRAQAMAYL